MGFDDFIGDVFEGALDVAFGTAAAVCDVAVAVKDAVVENPGKAALIAVATVVTGGAALAAAPAIGAAASAAGLGVAGGTLSGAAASSAGLAALGGGSLAAGGAGRQAARLLSPPQGPPREQRWQVLQPRRVQHHQRKLDKPLGEITP